MNNPTDFDLTLHPSFAQLNDISKLWRETARTIDIKVLDITLGLVINKDKSLT